jgi:two-component system, NtrC family, nitrogen regulation sensor histidine kinase NtrY
VRFRPTLRFQDRIVLITLAAVAPAWSLAALLLWQWHALASLRWFLFVVITVSALASTFVLRSRVLRPLQSLANILEAVRSGDYSLRGHNEDTDDALGEVMHEVNELSRALHERRLDALEAGALLEKLVNEIDIAVFAFDERDRLRLVNRAGERLLAGSAEALRGHSAVELGLDELFAVSSGRIVPRVFPGGWGRWEVRQRSFREGGRPCNLLVISELSHALREEERQAWQRLVRVIGHELNNSLAPIKSMASTLGTLLARDPLPDDWRDDTRSALSTISARAESLNRFMGGYARLARLPPPRKQAASISTLVQRAAALQGPRVVVEPGAELLVDADADQIEQVLINLLKNGLEAGGGDGDVRLRWRRDASTLVIEIEDDGPGIANTDNLWVPFFTTKPGGTGIGLALSREIVERHGGAIALENRTDARGCIARLRLPL